MASDTSSELSSISSVELTDEDEVMKGFRGPEAPPVPLPYRKKTCSKSLTRICPVNHGNIEVDNDTCDEEEEDEEEIKEESDEGCDGDDEEDYEDVIVAMKVASKKTAKSPSTPREVKPKPVLPVQKVQRPAILPKAPVDPVVPATLCSRVKHPHFAGGWHGRTITESDAARKLKSLIDEDVGDLSSIIKCLVTKASPKTLRLITEGDEKTIEITLKAIVKKFRETPHTYKIRYRRVEIPDEREGAEEERVKVEDKEDDVKPVLDERAREALREVLVKIEEKLAGGQDMASIPRAMPADSMMVDGRKDVEMEMF